LSNRSGLSTYTPHITGANFNNFAFGGTAPGNQTSLGIMSAGSVAQRGNALIANNPYSYLRWQQQKYKSCRSTIYSKKQQAYALAKQATTGGPLQANQCVSSCSSGSAKVNRGHNISTSSTNAPGCLSNVKSLSEVKNPQFLISFRFSDRKVKEIKDISLFKNLTELDLSGNLLYEEVTELR